jgi:aryl-alcohol dehydrogenase-like predicted oxidoreductase
VRNELVTTIRSYARNNVKPDGINATEFTRAWIAEHPTFKATELARHFEANGRAKGTVYGALKALVDEGVMKALGGGNYTRTDVKRIAAPKKKATAAPKQFDIPSHYALLSIARRNHGRFTSELAKKHFAVQGRSPQGVGPTISRLLKEKMIRRTETGSYELTAKGSDGGKAKVPTKKLNGAAPHAPDQVIEQPMES